VYACTFDPAAAESFSSKYFSHSTRLDIKPSGIMRSQHNEFGALKASISVPQARMIPHDCAQ
jgi:hypothetical protein